MTPLYPCSHAHCGQRIVIGGLDFDVALLPTFKAHGWGLLEVDKEEAKLYSTPDTMGGIAPELKVLLAFCPDHTAKFGALVPAADLPRGLLFGSRWTIAQRCAGRNNGCAAYLPRNLDNLIQISNPPRGAWTVAVLRHTFGGKSFVRSCTEFLCPRDRRKAQQAARSRTAHPRP